MKNYLDFSGKNVIVTGSRGIGRFFAADECFVPIEKQNAAGEF